jgi:hypothetical protein
MELVVEAQGGHGLVFRGAEHRRCTVKVLDLAAQIHRACLEAEVHRRASFPLPKDRNQLEAQLQQVAVEETPGEQAEPQEQYCAS